VGVIGELTANREFASGTLLTYLSCSSRRRPFRFFSEPALIGSCQLSIASRQGETIAPRQHSADLPTG
jgi:hypothetical protein